MATKSSSKSNTAALEALAKQTGGKIQADKNRVEYKVSGPGWKSTRYVSPGEEVNMGAPAANARDPRPYATVDRNTGETVAPMGVPTQLSPEETPLGYDEAAQNLAKGGLQGNALSQAQTALAGKYGVPGGAQAPVQTPGAAPTPTQNRYQQGLAAANASGLPAPADAGEARMQATSYIPPAETPSMVDAFISDDPSINALMQGITQLLNPPQQTTTLMQDYKRLYRDVGLDEINEELIDADTVINGTEDDIRNEIQTAGGFGTESQIQAMSLARNKGLLKRYNQLVQMKTDATNQLNTLMSLNAQDKQMAQAKIDSQINTMFQMANFRQQAINNVREQYQFMVGQVGVDGVYNAYANDPVQVARIEKILGVQPGGLAGFAASAAEQRALDRQEQIARIAASNRSNQPAATKGGVYQLAGGGYIVPYNGELTNQEQAKIRDIEVGEALVDQMEKVYWKSVGEGVEGASARPRGLGRIIGAAIGTNQSYKEYQNFVNSNLTPIAKGLKGEVGAVTASDTKNAKAALPNAYSSKSEAEAAFRLIREQLRDQKGTYGDIIIPL